MFASCINHLSRILKRNKCLTYDFGNFSTLSEGLNGEGMNDPLHGCGVHLHHSVILTKHIRDMKRGSETFVVKYSILCTTVVQNVSQYKNESQTSKVELCHQLDFVHVDGCQ